MKRERERSVALTRVGGTREVNFKESLSKKLNYDELINLFFDAKCHDLEIKGNEVQRKRFIDQMNKNIQVKRAFDIDQQGGLGEMSAKIIAKILSRKECNVKEIDLRNNDFGDGNVAEIAKAIGNHSDCIYLKMGSIGVEQAGFEAMMGALEKNQSIIHLNLSNTKHIRNKINESAWHSFGGYLEHNSTLTILNLSNTLIGP